jgi:hypothetical protein
MTVTDSQGMSTNAMPANALADPEILGDILPTRIERVRNPRNTPCLEFKSRGGNHP